MPELPAPVGSAQENGSTGRRRRGHLPAMVALAIAVLLCSAACSPLTDLPFLGGGGGSSPTTVSTPAFHLAGSAEITVSVSAPPSEAGVPITVMLSCAGGTTASQTVVLSLQGGVALGQTTFHQGWPAGADCFVSQQIVQGIDAIPGALQYIGVANQWVANFVNQL